MKQKDCSPIGLSQPGLPHGRVTHSDLVEILWRMPSLFVWAWDRHWASMARGWGISAPAGIQTLFPRVEYKRQYPSVSMVTGPPQDHGAWKEYNGILFIFDLVNYFAALIQTHTASIMRTCIICGVFFIDSRFYQQKSIASYQLIHCPFLFKSTRRISCERWRLVRSQVC